MLVALALCRLRYLPEGPWLKAFWAACVPLLPQPQQQQDGGQQQQQVLGRSSVNSKKHRRSSSRSSRRSGRGSDVEAGSRVQLSQAELVVLVTSAYELSLLTRPQSVGPWKGQKPPRAWLDGVAAASAGGNGDCDRLIRGAGVSCCYLTGVATAVHIATPLTPLYMPKTGALFAAVTCGI
jgi:hypothetical protein